MCKLPANFVSVYEGVQVYECKYVNMKVQRNNFKKIICVFDLVLDTRISKD